MKKKKMYDKIVKIFYHIIETLFEVLLNDINSQIHAKN